MFWGDARRRTIVIAGAGLAFIALAVLVVSVIAGAGASSALDPSARPTPGATRIPFTPTPSVSQPPMSTAPPVAEPAPPAPEAAPVDAESPVAAPPVAPPQPAAPAAPPAAWSPPGVTQFGWADHDAFVQCPDWSGGQVVKTFTWTAVDATSVDLYVAMNDRDAQATDGYQLVASGLPTSGSTGVPITCSEATLHYTVKVVAVNGGDSRAAHFWGGIGL